MILQAKAEAKKALEDRDAMAADLQEFRRTSKELKGIIFKVAYYSIFDKINIARRTVT